MYLNMYICLCICIHIYIYNIIYVCVSVYLYMDMYIYFYMYMHMHMHMYVYLNMYMDMYMYASVCKGNIRCADRNVCHFRPTPAGSDWRALLSSHREDLQARRTVLGPGVYGE